jgi:hypothetical protein
MLLLIVLIFSCDSETIDKDFEAYKQTPDYILQQKIMKAREHKIKRNVYIGYESIRNPHEACVPVDNENYYAKCRLFLRNDSAFMEKAGIYININNELNCIDKGNFAYYKGVIDSSENNVNICLYEILRSCGEEYEQINDKYKRTYDTLNLEGQIGQGGIILNGISYKLRIDSNIFMSMFYERDSMNDILDSLPYGSRIKLKPLDQE